jgi:hypothetical protein
MPANAGGGTVTVCTGKRLSNLRRQRLKATLVQPTRARPPSRWVSLAAWASQAVANMLVFNADTAAPREPAGAREVGCHASSGLRVLAAV